MTVKIDKYVKTISESRLEGWIRDESTEKVIVKVEMDSEEHTLRLIDLCLEALNSGEFEDV